MSRPRQTNPRRVAGALARLLTTLQDVRRTYALAYDLAYTAGAGAGGGASALVRDSSGGPPSIVADDRRERIRALLCVVEEAVVSQDRQAARLSDAVIRLEQEVGIRSQGLDVVEATAAEHRAMRRMREHGL